MASKRRIRRKSCRGKQRFPTHLDASNAMHRLIRTGDKRGGWLRVYKCKFCGGHHYGHTRFKEGLNG